MQDAVILSAVRTPVGKIRGALSSVRPDDLLALVFREALARTGKDPQALASELDDAIAGCANQAGEDNRNVARMAALLTGLPDSVPGVTVNRLCASGLEAISQAARAIRAGEGELFLAGGVESMSRAPWAVQKPEAALPSGPLTSFDTSLGWRFPNPRLAARFPLEQMGETAENVAERCHVTRADQDAFALRSHQRALEAWNAGRYTDEIVVVPSEGKPAFDRDEQPRSDTSLEKLSKLKAAFRAGGTVTAGNSSSLNDGAAALVISSAAKAKSLGVKPLARIVASAAAGVDPQVMGLGPIPATQKVLARAGWKIADLTLIELNEAFAAQSLAVMRELGLDESRVNVNGGAIAIGHPLGMSGARLVTTLVHELRRRGGGRGLATLCVGVGQGASLLVEV